MKTSQLLLEAAAVAETNNENEPSALDLVCGEGAAFSTASHTMEELYGLESFRGDTPRLVIGFCFAATVAKDKGD